MLGSKLFVLCSTLLATAQGYWLSDMKRTYKLCTYHLNDNLTC